MPNLQGAVELFQLESAGIPTMTTHPSTVNRPNNGGAVSNVPGLKAKKFSTTSRKKLAKSGKAKPDGSYPITSPKDVENAVKDWHRSHGSPSDKAHIQKRAKALGVSDPFGK